LNRGGQVPDGAVKYNQFINAVKLKGFLKSRLFTERSQFEDGFLFVVTKHSTPHQFRRAV